MTQKGGIGVSLVTADGGFSVDDDYNSQELKLRQLVLCQFTTALGILRQGGTFLCKIFDVYTPFTVELFYLLSTVFSSFTIIKPLQSRPANSERYILCRGFLLDQRMISETSRINKSKEKVMEKDQQQIGQENDNELVWTEEDDNKANQQRKNTIVKYLRRNWEDNSDQNQYRKSDIKIKKVSGSDQTENIFEYLLFVNSMINKLALQKQNKQYSSSSSSFSSKPQPAKQITHLYPVTQIPNQFIQFIRNSNITIAQQQKEWLENILRYIRNDNLVPVNQQQVREQCLTMLGIPILEVTQSNQIGFNYQNDQERSNNNNNNTRRGQNKNNQQKNNINQKSNQQQDQEYDNNINDEQFDSKDLYQLKPIKRTREEEQQEDEKQDKELNNTGVLQGNQRIRRDEDEDQIQNEDQIDFEKGYEFSDESEDGEKKQKRNGTGQEPQMDKQEEGEQGKGIAIDIKKKRNQAHIQNQLQQKKLKVRGSSKNEKNKKNSDITSTQFKLDESNLELAKQKAEEYQANKMNKY